MSLVELGNAFQVQFRKIRTELVSKLEYECPNSLTTDKVKAINERKADPITTGLENILDNIAAKQLLEFSELISNRCGLKDNRGVL